MTDISKCREVIKSFKYFNRAFTNEFQANECIDALQTCLTILSEYEKVKRERKLCTTEIGHCTGIIKAKDKEIEELKNKVLFEGSGRADIRCEKAWIKVRNELEADRDRLQSIVRDLKGALEKIAWLDNRTMQTATPEFLNERLSHILDIAKQALNLIEKEK